MSAVSTQLSAKDITDLDQRIVDTIDQKAIYFSTDIAEHLGITHGMASERLEALMKADRVEKVGACFYVVEDSRENQTAAALPVNGNVQTNGSKPNTQPEKKSEDLWPILDVDTDEFEFDLGSKRPDKDVLKRLAEIKEQILAAIDAQYRLYPSIKKFIGAPDAFDLGNLLEDMQSDFILRKWDMGKVWAYFRYETLPKRAWMLGAGQVDAEWDETFEPRDEKAKREELANGKKAPTDGTEGAAKKQQSKEINADELYFAALEAENFEAVAEQLDASTFYLQMCIDKNPELKATFDRAIAQNPDYTHSKPVPQKAAAASKNGSDTSVAAAAPSLDRLMDIQMDVNDMQDQTEKEIVPDGARRAAPKGLKLTAEIVRKAAAEGMSKLAFARKMSVGANTIDYHLQKPELAKAWDEGRKIYEDGSGEKPRPRRSSHFGGRQALTIDPVKVEELAAEGKTDKEIAEALGIGYSTFTTKKTHYKEISEAVEQGRKTTGSPRRGGYEWSEELFRNAARDGLTKTKLAENVGCHSSAVGKILDTHPEYRKAWDEGVKLRRQNQDTANVAEALNGPVKKTGRGFALNFTEDDVEKAAALHGKRKATAQALGYAGVNAFARKLEKFPKLAEAYERGKATYLQSNNGFLKGITKIMPVDGKAKRVEKMQPAFEGPIERFPSRIGMEIDQRVVLRKSPGIAEHVNSTRTEIVVPTGIIAFECEVNLFAMSREERDRLMELVDAVQKFGGL